MEANPMLEVLLLARDSELIAPVALACAKQGINLTTCSGAEEGAALLTRRKMYAVLVDDADASAAAKLLSMAEKSSSSRNAVTIAFVGTSSRSFKATFLVPKPLSAEIVLRTLRAAEGQMLSEFRRYFRHPLQATVTVYTETNEQLQASAINISRSGLAIQFLEPKMLTGNSAVRASFIPPTEAAACLELRGRVVWADQQGRAGFHCCGATQSDQKRLEQWLAALPTHPGRYETFRTTV